MMTMSPGPGFIAAGLKTAGSAALRLSAIALCLTKKIRPGSRFQVDHAFNSPARAFRNVRIDQDLVLVVDEAGVNVLE